jgi:hypothetical protein
LKEHSLQGYVWALQRITCKLSHCVACWAILLRSYADPGPRAKASLVTPGGVAVSLLAGAKRLKTLGFLTKSETAKYPLSGGGLAPVRQPKGRRHFVAGRLEALQLGISLQSRMSVWLAMKRIPFPSEGPDTILTPS